MKINTEYIYPLVREIKAGKIQRANYPELWPLEEYRKIGPGGVKIDWVPKEPAEIPQADRKKLARAILKGEVNTDDYPYLWEGDQIKVILPDGEVLFDFFVNQAK